MSPNTPRISGRVLWFNDIKGYGFLQANSVEKSIFAHYSAISGDGFKTLAEDQAVTFVLIDGPHGPQASEIEKAVRS
jgi:CspA family cold shock protein